MTLPRVNGARVAGPRSSRPGRRGRSEGHHAPCRACECHVLSETWDRTNEERVMAHPWGSSTLPTAPRATHSGMRPDCAYRPYAAIVSSTAGTNPTFPLRSKESSGRRQQEAARPRVTVTRGMGSVRARSWLGRGGPARGRRGSGSLLVRSRRPVTPGCGHSPWGRLNEVEGLPPGSGSEVAEAWWPGTPRVAPSPRSARPHEAHRWPSTPSCRPRRQGGCEARAQPIPRS